MTKVQFPTMLRKMWSGTEVQAWLDEHVNETAQPNNELIKVVKSLISDIEAMQERPQTYPEQFGPFSEYDDDNGRSVVVEWPNLAISLAEMKKLLEPKTIEGELTPPVIAP